MAQTGAEWQRALVEVPRELFIPELIWVEDHRADGYVPVTRSADPDRWSALVAADEPVVTQVDDGRTALGSVGRSPSSSCSKPSIVAEMLRIADIGRGHSVLEIGTGTGWNAALLCVLVGERGQVVSVEVDIDLADAARAALKRTGFPATVVAADGAAGHPPAAPFDRVLSTAAVRWQLPSAWVHQTRPGGTIVTPWGTSFHNGALLRLHVVGGTANGRFGGQLAFMRLRAQRGPDWVDDDDLTNADTTTTTLTSSEIGQAVDSFDGAFAVGLHLPDCRLHVDEHPADGQLWVWLSDGRSVARVMVNLGGSNHQVHQRGPRRLWHEVEVAYAWWQRTGQPDHTRFGVTVTSEHQTVWLDDPAQTVAGPATTPDG